jgi:hypothetical protein
MGSRLRIILAELKRRKVHHVAVVLVLGCGRSAPLTLETPLHLEEHLTTSGTTRGASSP